MKKSIFRNIFISSSISIVLTLALFFPILINQRMESVKNELSQSAQLLKSGWENLENQDTSLLSKDNVGKRITIIDQKGTVIFDNEKAAHQFENHLDREEVKQALTTGVGNSKRLSNSFSQQYYYHAVKLDDDYILRIAVETKSLYATLAELGLYSGLFLLVAFVAFYYIARWQTKKLVAPINAIDLDHPLESEVYDEMQPLLERIASQNQLIEKQVGELERSKEEFIQITNTMNEGLFMLNQHGEVILMNTKIEAILGVTFLNQLPFIQYVRHASVRKLIEQSLQGEQVEQVVEIDEKVYQFIASPLEDKGVAILCIDIHERFLAEELRRNFSANVSHELKTPLQSISGYAELLAAGLVEEDKVKSFSGKIHQESLRLMTLINEIILLSKIDEGYENEQVELVLLEPVVQEVIAALDVQLKEKNMTVHLEMDEVKLVAAKPLIFEMIYNLCENAIKYGKDDGDIWINLDSSSRTLSVRDNGIGMNANQQEHIFERFYRGTTSIDGKQIEGTGIGLSFIKHIAKLYHIEMTVESELGSGSKFILQLPSLK